jgi:hypothetical protein
MSDHKFGSKEFLRENSIAAWANVPREVVLRAMAPDQCLDSRLRHAMILWSWCGPEGSETVVRKDEDGFIVPGKANAPVPAQLKDLGELLGLAPGMKGHITRVAQGMVAQGLLRFEGQVMRLAFKPPTFDQSQLPSMATGAIWNIAGLVITRDDLPADPVAMHEAIQFLDSCHARWKEERNQVNARNRELTRTGIFERGISIEKSKKSLRVEENNKQTFSPVPTAVTQPAPEPVRSSVAPLSLKEVLRAWLTGKFPLPTGLSPQVLDEIAAHIPDDRVFEQFCKAAENAQPEQSWRYFIPIAEACEANRETYAAAASQSNGGRRPDPKRDRIREILRERHGDI